MWQAARKYWRALATAALLAGVVAAIVSLARPQVGLVPDLAQQGLAEAPRDLAHLEESIGHWQASSAEEKTAYLRWLTDVGLENARRKMSAHLSQRAQSDQSAAAVTINNIFSFLALASLALLIAPLFVPRERFPKRGRLWIHAALSVGILCVTFLLLSGALELFLNVSANTTRMANPQQALTNAAIDEIHTDAMRVLREGADVEKDPLPYGPAVSAQGAGYDGGFLTNLLQSLQYFDPEVFKPAIVWTHRTWALLGHLPSLVPIVVALVFLLTMRHMVFYVVSMPYRAAQGEERAVRRALGAALGFVGKEVAAILLLLVVLVLLSQVINAGSHHVSRSIVQLALHEVRTSVDYFGRLSAAPDQTRLAVGTMALPVYLGLTTLWTVCGFGLFAFWARRVIQLRFHRRVPLRAHDRFWRRGILAVLQLQWIPVLVLWALLPYLISVHEGPAPSGADASDALRRLMTTAWVLGLGMVAGYLLFGGLRAGKTLLMFRPRKTTPAPPYTLREALPEDAAFLRQAHDEGLRASVEQTWGLWDEALQAGFVDRWLAEVKSQAGGTQVIEVRGKPAGYLEVHEEEEAFLLSNIVLIPSFQGRGLGTEIIGQVQERAGSLGKHVRLQVMTGNGRARALYERLGFVVTDEAEFHTQMRWV